MVEDKYFKFEPTWETLCAFVLLLLHSRSYYLNTFESKTEQRKRRRKKTDSETVKAAAHSGITLAFDAGKAQKVAWSQLKGASV